MYPTKSTISPLNNITNNLISITNKLNKITNNKSQFKLTDQLSFNSINKCLQINFSKKIKINTNKGHSR